MRDISLDNITEAVIQHADKSKADPRLYQIYAAFIRHMHAFAREVKLTERELTLGRQFFTRLGRPHQEMPDGEVHMFSDLIGLSELVELMHDLDRGNATETNLEGPLYVAGAPDRNYGDVLGVDPEGETLFLSGRILSSDGKPVANALIDVWQPNSKGFYDLQDPEQPPMNFRGKYRTDDQGRYLIETVVPLGYNVPSSGPSGDVLRLLGRHTWRPAHIHFKLSADGCVPITTMLYVEGAAFVDSDTTFSVKTALIDCKKHEDKRELEAAGRTAPFYTATYDFVLKPAAMRRAAE